MAEANSTVTYKDIPGFPGYRAGDDGSIWSCRKVVGLGRGSKGVLGDSWRRVKVHPQSPTDPRPRVVLIRDGRPLSCRVCRLVLEAFVGPCPDGMQACHFPDRDPTNNCLSNLRWATNRDNAADRDAHGTTARGERHWSAKLTAATVRKIRADHAAGAAYRALSRRYGVSRVQIKRIVDRVTWSHVP